MCSAVAPTGDASHPPSPDTGLSHVTFCDTSAAKTGAEALRSVCVVCLCISDSHGRNTLLTHPQRGMGAGVTPAQSWSQALLPDTPREGERKTSICKGKPWNSGTVCYVHVLTSV